ncbi:MAG: cyclic-di-AMP receptor [Anaerolineaceae bacterium]|jgi:uncharacterized protein YaaQ
MKMVMAVVPKKRGEELLNALIEAGFTATYNETRGGMLRQSQITLFIAVRADDVPKVLDVIRGVCSEGSRVHQGFRINGIEGQESLNVEMATNSAVVFIWSLDQFELT